MIETDPEQFDCGACPVADRIGSLDEANLAAWHVFHRLCSRFAIETRSTGALLARALEDHEDPDGLADRLMLLYPIHFPPKKATRGA